MRCFISLLVLVTCLTVIIGCTVFSPIVGKWKDTKSSDTVEFTSDGKVIVANEGYIITGTYELVGSDVVKLRLEGLGGAWISLFGGDTWQYTISGDTMTASLAGKKTTFKRVRISNTGS